MRSNLPALAPALLLGALATAAMGQAPVSPPPFTETIEVREVEVFFDTSPLPRFESIGKKAIEDFAAFEAGATHDLLEMSSTSGADWVHVLWFDDALASREALASAAMALARRAAILTAGGRAEIVVADPMPRLLTATSMPDLLERALNELAGRWLEAAGRPDAGRDRAAPASVSDRSRQLDRLVVDIVSRGGGGPHALWLAVDGWPLSPQDLEKWSRAKPGEVADVPERRTVVEAGRVLAGYAWVTFPVAIRPVREVPATKDGEQRVEVQSGGTGDERTSVPMFTVSGGQERTPGGAEAQVSTVTDFSLAPLAELARSTSGALLGTEERLRAELSELVERRRATYRAPRPEPGALLPVEIRWRGGDGRALPAARYLRSSTPVEVTAARLRALLAGDPAPPHPGIVAGGGSGEYCFQSEADEIPVRLSAARQRSDGSIDLAMGETRILKRDGGRRCANLPGNFSAVESGVAWVAENLDDESWTGGVR